MSIVYWCWSMYVSCVLVPGVEVYWLRDFVVYEQRCGKHMAPQPSGCLWCFGDKESCETCGLDGYVQGTGIQWHDVGTWAGS